MDNDIQTARELLQHAVRCGDDNPRPHLALAALYLDQGLIRTAETHYQRALQVDPESAEAHFKMALFYETTSEVTNNA